MTDNAKYYGIINLFIFKKHLKEYYIETCNSSRMACQLCGK